MEMFEPTDSVEALSRVRNALRGMQDAFAIDHYAMDVISLRNHEIKIGIRALDGACAECLVSHDMITNLIRTQIPSDLSDCSINVHLDVPNDWVCEL